MTLRPSRTRVVVVILTLALFTCHSPPRLGVARQQSLCSITNVVVDPVLYHWEDPDHLLEATEGFGPRTLTLHVSTSVEPTVSVTITRTPSGGSSGGGGSGGSGGVPVPSPASGWSSGGWGSSGPEEVLQLLDNSEVTTELGYSVTQSFALEADSSVLVPVDGYARLEAFTAFQRATWDSVGPHCSGTGISYKPVGVYFKTCMALAGCPSAEGPIPAGKGGADAGAAEDAGDAGEPGDAGAAEDAGDAGEPGDAGAAEDAGDAGEPGDAGDGG